MKKSLTIISTILVLSMLAGAAFAWGPGSGRGRGAGYDCPGYTGQSAASNLTQEQTDQLAALRQRHIDDTYADRSARIAKKQQLRLLMQTSNPNRTELIKLSNDIIDLDKKLAERRVDYQLEVKKIVPELSAFGKRGFGKGCGMWSGSRGQGGFQGGNGPETF